MDILEGMDFRGKKLLMYKKLDTDDYRFERVFLLSLKAKYTRQ